MGVSLEEMFGEEVPQVEPTRQVPLAPGGMTLEQMTGQQTLEDEADQGFFRQAWLTAKDLNKEGLEAMKSDPVGFGYSFYGGVAKETAKGLVSLGRLAAAGVAGLARSATNAWAAASSPTAKLSGVDLAADQAASQAMVDKFLEEDKKFSQGLLYINLAPKDRMQEATESFMQLIPGAITAAGDNVYEKTGSALAGAGTQALLTLVSMRPSVASKTFGGMKKLVTGDKQTPGAATGAQKVKSNFEELAKKEPEAAEAVAEHVGKADPELEAILKESIESVKNKPAEKVGEEAAKQAETIKPAEPVKPEFRQVGTTPEGKPRVRAVQPQQIADKITEVTFEANEIFQKPDMKLAPDAREAARVRANEQAARQLIQEELKNIEHLADDITGEHTLKMPGAEMLAQENGPYLQIKRTDVQAPLRGKGINQGMIAKLVDEAQKRDLVVSSDVTVSRDAQRVYAALKKKGFVVKENPNTVNAQTGSKVSNDPRVPVYTVARLQKPAVTPPATPDPVLYMDAGIPVTRSKVESAFRLGSKALDKVPGVGVVKGKLTEYYDQLIKTVNPEALGPEAKVSASVLAKHIAKQMQNDSTFHHRAAERRSFWNHREAEAADFINKFEKGVKFEDPLMNKAAEGYRQWNEEIYQADQRAGLDYQPVDNYLYHLFENSEGVSAFLTRRYGPKWNNPKFIKERSLDLYSEAIKAGYKPRFTNPEDIMLARQHASDIAHMRIDTLNELAKVGLAKPVGPKGAGRPEAWPSSEWRSPTGERFWVHDSASAVLDNAFNTQSLWSMRGAGGDLFRGAMALKNTIVPIKLALSLFHPLHVATIDNATGMVRASKELLSGTKSPASWMKEMGEAAVYKGAIKHTKVGYRLLKAYQGKLADADISPADRQSLTFMAEGGMIPEMAAQYKTNAVANFKAAVERRSLAAAWHAPLAAVSMLQKPMFEIWIPSLKIASYLKDVQTALKVDPTLLDNPTKRQVAFRRIAKSVDNRYGEMAYNTLFWNRWVKDLAVANTLSLGWQLGFIREYGGGLMDLGHVVTKQGSVVEKAKSGMLDRPLFVTFYTTQALAYGGLLTWALTGEEPQDFNDYIYPRSGNTKPDGSPERLNTMFYPREFAAIYKHMENEGVVTGLGHLAGNKASGVVGMTREWATGVNSFGQEIRDPNAPAYKQLEQTIVHTLTELEPISVGAIREQLSETPVKSALLNIAGFSPAPQYATESKTEGLIKGTFKKYFSAKQTPFDKAQFSDDRRKLRKAYDAGDQDTYGELIDKMQEKYQLTGLEQRRLEVSIARGEDPIFSMFERLTWRQQKKILDQMSEEEREVFLPHANRQHLRYSYEPPEESD